MRSAVASTKVITVADVINRFICLSSSNKDESASGVNISGHSSDWRQRVHAPSPEKIPRSGRESGHPAVGDVWEISPTGPTVWGRLAALPWIGDVFRLGISAHSLHSQLPVIW